LTNTFVWTGSNPFGVGLPGLTLGGSGTTAAASSPDDATGTWTHVFNAGLPATFALYALSDPITVPLPEPATVTLLGSALLLFGGMRWLRWRRAAGG
jgi:hypothetical protein